MTHQFSISDLGLRLIKAYEGYRAQSRELISGEHVVGFGHRLADQDIILLTPEEAEKLLREDIAPVEDLVNEAIFAPLTQGQFDALCSLAYNIGDEAFLASNVLKAINNGRPVEAADGFDVWRKGEIDGQVLVIDALVRRRTAEKALFLKPGPIPVTSPRDSLPPLADAQISETIASSQPVFTAGDAQNYVGPVPYETQPNQGRRREDGPAGVLELSEYVEDIDDNMVDDLGFVPSVNIEDDAEDVSPRANLPSDDDAMVLSPIAEAAAEVSTRLDALIDDFDKPQTDLSGLPDTLLDTGLDDNDLGEMDAQKSSVILPFRKENIDTEDQAETEFETITSDIDDEDIADQITDMDETADQEFAPDIAETELISPEPQSSIIAYGIMLITGVLILGLSFHTWMSDPVALLGKIGPIAALVGIIMGGVIIFASIWYILKSGFKTKT